MATIVENAPIHAVVMKTVTLFPPTFTYNFYVAKIKQK